MKIAVREIIYIIHIIGLILVFKVKAFGQTSYELQCKAQAKELALQTYQTCVTENRQAQIESVRQEYQQKLMELKEHYNQELKKAGGKNGSDEGATVNLKSNKKTAKKGKPEKGKKGVAKILPKKQNDNGPALPTQIVTDEPPVVPAPVYEESPEKEAAQLEQDNVEVVDPNTY
jgi:hypothetical protein